MIAVQKGKGNIFAEYIEGKALAQFHSALKEPYSVKGALMPDAHAGYSLPIGGVVATDGMIVPAWVGYDIGCGMCALPLDEQITAEQVSSHAQEIFEEIYRTIPVGLARINEQPQQDATDLNLSDLSRESARIVEEKKWLYVLGSLGSGNHFIEIGKDEKGRVWVIVHSGSRGVGYGIAQYYMKLAGGGRAREGHYPLAVTSEAGQAYINDLSWTLQYALDNRKAIMEKVLDVVNKFCGNGNRLKIANMKSLINRNHNHAVQRDGLWIHRKGATHAEKGMMGVIPGNMRDGSFIVRGLGNPDALWSSSHGAGRVLGRKEAKSTLSIDRFKQAMSGIVARVEEDTLDEAPHAYKNIFEVMELQADLVEVVAHIRPILNIKG